MKLKRKGQGKALFTGIDVSTAQDFCGIERVEETKNEIE